jgi:transcriptional regulator with XRE-family HTH domain
MHKGLFRKNLKSIMGELGITQQELADKMGIKQQQISYWLTGKNSPTYRSLIKLSDALDKPINFFLENSDLEKSGGAVQRDDFDGFKREVAKDVEIIKLQIELLKIDLLKSKKEG